MTRAPVAGPGPRRPDDPGADPGPVRPGPRRRPASGSGRRALPIAGGVAAAALVGLALDNRRRARRAERDNPPVGGVAEFGGAALHWIDTDPGGERTSGPPVVLLHGNLVTLDDWIASGVPHRLADAGRRVVAFDRPGFGHSERPRGRRWGAREQAAHLARAARAIGLDRPVVVGHSWGALPALAWALDGQGGIAGAVLVSGYYHRSPRLDALLVAPAAVPVLGDVLRHTVAPPFARATLPSTLKAMFSPRSVPSRFRALFPNEMVSRPSQIRAAAREGAIMLPEAGRLLRRLHAEPRGLRCPVAIVAGLEDRIVDPHDQSGRLADALPGSRLTLVRGAGHMVHHAAPDAVADAALALADRPAPAGEAAGYSDPATVAT